MQDATVPTALEWRYIVAACYEGYVQPYNIWALFEDAAPAAECAARCEDALQPGHRICLIRSPRKPDDSSRGVLPR